jgi:hypothetical protein
MSTTNKEIGGVWASVGVHETRNRQNDDNNGSELRAVIIKWHMLKLAAKSATSIMRLEKLSK